MAKAAEAALNLDLTASWVVGDRPEDVGLAEADRRLGRSTWDPTACRASWRLVVSEPCRRGPVHPGAHRRMTSVYDLQAFAPPQTMAPQQVPGCPYASAASYFDAIRRGDFPGREDSSSLPHSIARPRSS